MAKAVLFCFIFVRNLKTIYMEIITGILFTYFGVMCLMLMILPGFADNLDRMKKVIDTLTAITVMSLIALILGSIYVGTSNITFV